MVVIMPSEDLTKLEKDLSESKLVSTKTKIIKTQDNYKYFSNQVRSLIIALVLCVIVYFIPVSILQNKKVIWAMIIGVTAFQILVFVPALEARYGTARGWIDIP